MSASCEISLAKHSNNLRVGSTVRKTNIIHLSRQADAHAIIWPQSGKLLIAQLSSKVISIPPVCVIHQGDSYNDLYGFRAYCLNPQHHSSQCQMHHHDCLPESQMPPAVFSKRPCCWSFVEQCKPHKSGHMRGKHTASLLVTSATGSTTPALLFSQGLGSCGPRIAIGTSPACNCQGSVAAANDVLAAVEAPMEGKFA